MTAQIIKLFEQPVEPPKCSFCGKPNKRMFDNSMGKYICGNCVTLASKKINETTGEK